MNRNHLTFTMLTLGISSGLFSCKKINPDLEIPTYLKVESSVFTADPLTQGTSSANITSAWVSVDGKQIGVFEIPFTAPALGEEGTHEISIEAGIKMNGMASTRANYLFYAPYKTTLTFEKEKTLLINPSFTYAGFVNFAWMENFELSSFSVEKHPEGDPSIIIEKAMGSEAFEGLQSCKINVHPHQTGFFVQSANEYALPKDGRDIFLEMDYKIDAEVTVGLLTATLNNVYEEATLVLKPNTSWNKIYIYLTPTAQYHSDAGGHHVFLKAENAGGELNFFFDNIKLIY